MGEGRKLKNDGGMSICWDKATVGLYQQNIYWEWEGKALEIG